MMRCSNCHVADPEQDGTKCADCGSTLHEVTPVGDDYV